MVMSVSNLSRSGLRDWLIQRLSALVLFSYIVVVLGCSLMHPHMTFVQWQGLFHNSFMQFMTFLVAFAIFTHIWIGLWTVITDYIKPTVLRFLCEVAVLLVICGYFYWIFYILFKL